MSNSFDVAIIGAGPAGTSAAQIIAESGLSTVIFEEHSEIGVPVQCGEGISRQLLDYHKIDHKNGSANWIKIHLPEQKFYFPGTPNLYGKDEFGVYTMVSGYDTFLVDRTKFDQMLASQAENAGAQILTNTKVINLKIDSRNGAELTTKDNSGNSSTFQSKMVVACDGPASRIAKSQGIKTPVKYVHAVEWKVEGQLSNSLDFYFDHNLTPHGYSWVFPKKNTSTIGLTCRQVFEPAKRLEKLMNIMENRLNQKFNRISVIGGMIPANPTLPRNTHKDRIILAGDAGGFTNPLFYGGISIAILTGRLAGETIVEIADNDIDYHFSAENLAQYETKWLKAETFNPEIYEGREIFYKNFENEQLEHMGNFANKINVGQIGWLRSKYLTFKAFLTTSEFRHRWQEYKKVVRAFSLSGEWGF